MESGQVYEAGSGKEYDMLETERLLLRKWTEEDADSLFEYAKDPEVGPIAGWPPHRSREESLDVIRNVLNGRECYAICEGSERLIAIADVIQELKTVCWCGRKATCNTRYNEHGIVRSGPQVMLGANDSYVALCRRHFKLGMLGPDAEAKEQCAE